MNEPLYLSRPGGADIAAATDAPAVEVAPGIWMSEGLSNSYLLTTDEGRIVVNTGMGFEGPTHRAKYDAVDDSPVRHVLLTQGHYDHVGGIDAMRDPESEIVAQGNWAAWRADNERLNAFRSSNAAFAWMDAIVAAMEHARARSVGEGAGDVTSQSVLEPTITFDDRHTIELGGRRLELIATPGGETTDSMIIWLPDEGVCLCGNVFGALFGHIPNLVTMRGDRYRDALTVIESIEIVRGLGAEVLLTGHFEPVRGADVIDAELTRLRDAVLFVHDATVAGMDAGRDVRSLMREISLPPDLEVGEGYGKVSWDVRAIWENYAGWFHHESTTELYDTPASSVHSDLVELAGGVDAIVERAVEKVFADEPLEAIHLAEIALTVDPGHVGARAVMADAHGQLLERSENFWETAWLRRQIAKATR